MSTEEITNLQGAVAALAKAQKRVVELEAELDLQKIETHRVNTLFRESEQTRCGLSEELATVKARLADANAADADYDECYAGVVADILSVLADGKPLPAIDDHAGALAELTMQVLPLARAVRAELAVVKAERDAWKKAIEGLTPSGSEFVNDPKRCAEFIRSTTQWPKQIIEARKERDAAIARAEAAEAREKACAAGPWQPISQAPANSDFVLCANGDGFGVDYPENYWEQFAELRPPATEPKRDAEWGE